MLLASAGLAAAIIWSTSEYLLRARHHVRLTTIGASRPPSVVEGQRLAKLYGCTSCHGQNYRGSVYSDDPRLVRNYAPNLTLIAARSSDAQLEHAIRHGVRATDGRALWGMPSATFHTVSDTELADVIAHLRSLPRGGAIVQNGAPGVAARVAMVRGLFATGEGTQRSALVAVADARLRPPVDRGPGFARGRHLASTICSEFHGSDLGGDIVEGGPDLLIAGAYDLEAFRRLMRTGLPPGGRDLGLMRETASEDLRVFTDEEIAALHEYLVERARS